MMLQIEWPSATARYRKKKYKCHLKCIFLISGKKFIHLKLLHIFQKYLNKVFEIGSKLKKKTCESYRSRI